MLNRQKALLALLHVATSQRPDAGNDVPRTKLMKWAFLLRQDLGDLGLTYAYDFVPYKYGPFSFGLYRDLRALHEAGYVSVPDGEDCCIAVNHDKLKSLAGSFSDLPSPVRRSIGDVASKYGKMGLEPLLKLVYTSFPWFATRSERDDIRPKGQPAPPKPTTSAFTVGYEGKNIDSFFAGLLRDGISRVIDVRRNPISRKFGFAKSSLSSTATKLGIEYVHLPVLGISSSERQVLTSFHAYQVLLDRYENVHLNEQKAAVHEVVELLLEKPSAMLCMEKDVRCCHRGRLAQHIRREAGLAVVHLS